MDWAAPVDVARLRVVVLAVVVVAPMLMVLLLALLPRFRVVVARTEVVRVGLVELLPIVMALALVAPMLREVLAVGASRLGVRTLVLPWRVAASPLPLIQKLAVVWADEFWFWM